jgi:hypothetical protein
MAKVRLERRSDAELNPSRPVWPGQAGRVGTFRRQSWPLTKQTGDSPREIGSMQGLVQHPG